MYGNVFAFDENADCTVQRNHQKAHRNHARRPWKGPEPQSARTAQGLLAPPLCAPWGYHSLATVEFPRSARRHAPILLKSNTRLQVEHGHHRKAAYGIDLVEEQIAVAFRRGAAFTAKKNLRAFVLRHAGGASNCEKPAGQTFAPKLRPSSPAMCPPGGPPAWRLDSQHLRRLRNSRPNYDSRRFLCSLPYAHDWEKGPWASCSAPLSEYIIGGIKTDHSPSSSRC